MSTARCLLGFSSMDIASKKVVVSEFNLPRITAPTLILQAIGDRSTTFDNAVSVSGLIPGARLVALESRNHILLSDEPAWATFISEVRDFLEPDRRRWATDDPSTESLSPRELDVLRLCAEGKTNDEIATALTLSPRTVERHLSNIYLKLGLTGSAARTAAVARFLRDS